MTPLTLWDRRRLTLAERYAAWRATDDGQAVYRAVLERALALRRRGFEHWGVKALWESVRYDRALHVGHDEDGWRCNNSYTALVARELMADCPELVGMFELRQRSAA